MQARHQGPAPIDHAMMNGIRPNRKLAWGTLILLIVIVATLLLGWRQDARSAKPASAPAPVAAQVTTAPVRQQDVAITRTGVGTVTPLASVTVHSRIDGQLERVGFTEGEDVKAGQLLAQLDARALEAQLAQAQAQRARDQAQLANARLDLRRYATLAAQGAATQQQLATQKALVAELEAALQMDQAQIGAARVQLDYTTIKAPISGRAGARLVDPGNIVHAADPGGLVVINQIDPIAVVFTLPEDAFQEISAALRSGDEAPAVLLSARGSKDTLAHGKLTLLNNQIDRASGTVQLKAQFDNAARALWPGQYVDARLVLGVRRDALTVPAAAVQRGANGLYVYTVDAGGTAQVQSVEVAHIADGTAVIERGLDAGQRVVVDGHYKLRPGLKVVEAERTGGNGTVTQ